MLIINTPTFPYQVSFIFIAKEDDFYRLNRFLIICSTTLESASVEISPKLSISFAATLRKILRIIFPERVLGKCGDH